MPGWPPPGSSACLDCCSAAFFRPVLSNDEPVIASARRDARLLNPHSCTIPVRLTSNRCIEGDPAIDLFPPVDVVAPARLRYSTTVYGQRADSTQGKIGRWLIRRV